MKGTGKMTTDPSALPARPLTWRGIHHLALATHDIEATINFYHHILGLTVTDIFPARAGRGRHAMVLVNPSDSDTLGLHFFERTNLAPPTQPATLASAAITGSLLLHIALRLADQKDAQQLRDRLYAHAIAITEIVELRSFVFSDNNALLIEVTWPQG